ncbi:MAG: hypothetical protein QOI13_125 [Paraburkholderia sp.]|nr:hypothetical protein [Paraburkholderia sp.]
MSLSKDVNNAVTNMVNSLNIGTFSQQGTQGALEGAASKDGLQGVLTPQINGASGMGSQTGGLYDGAQVCKLHPGLTVVSAQTYIF